MTLSLKERYAVARSTDEVWSSLADIALRRRVFPRCDSGAASYPTVGTKARWHSGWAPRRPASAASFTSTSMMPLVRRRCAPKDPTPDDRVPLPMPPSGSKRSMTTSTALDVDVAIEVGGPLGQFARAGGVEVTRTLLGDFAANVDERLASAAAFESAVPEDPAQTTRTAVSDDAVRVVTVVLRSARTALERAVARARTWLAARRGRPA